MFILVALLFAMIYILVVLGFSSLYVFLESLHKGNLVAAIFFLVLSIPCLGFVVKMVSKYRRTKRSL